MADIFQIILEFLAYKYGGLKCSKTVRISFKQVQESKNQIMIPFEYEKKKCITATVLLKHSILTRECEKINSVFMGYLENSTIVFKRLSQQCLESTPSRHREVTKHNIVGYVGLSNSTVELSRDEAAYTWFILKTIISVF